MKNRIARREFLAMALPFAVALPGYRYEFPRDYFAHPDFQTEWWYYTGNLESGNRRFGFQLTFFRQAKANEASSTIWSPDPIWFAQNALSDLQEGKFLHGQRLNRSGPGLAGADLRRGVVWNGNWQAGPKLLRSVDDAYSLDLTLDARKPPVIHGVKGISQKASGVGRASHYISVTRIRASGTLLYQGRRFPVDGLSWMDHEFFTHQLNPDQVGWDWFCIQLENETELMLFRLRRRDGSVDPYSAGTFIDKTGRGLPLSAEDFALIPSNDWTSPQTGARYPLTWQIHVPNIGIRLTATTRLPRQEVLSRNEVFPNYWEGSVDYRGTIIGKDISGIGYLELTGYDKPVAPL